MGSFQITQPSQWRCPNILIFGDISTCLGTIRGKHSQNLTKLLGWMNWKFGILSSCKSYISHSHLVFELQFEILMSTFDRHYFNALSPPGTALGLSQVYLNRLFRYRSSWKWLSATTYHCVFIMDGSKYSSVLKDSLKTWLSSKLITYRQRMWTGFLLLLST